MNKLMSSTAAALVALAWADVAGAQAADGCVLNAERFVALDRDADGSLSETEYSACMEALTGEDRQALKDQFATIDRDRDASISRTEAEQFVAEAPQSGETPPADAPQANDLPPEGPTSGPSVADAPDAAQEQSSPPPMGQREVTQGPLVLVPGARTGGEGAGEQPGAGGGQMAAVPAPPERPQTDPRQWQPLLGAKVTNLAGEGLGELSRLVASQDNEPAAVIESGGLLGFGTSYYVVPLPQLQIQGDRVVLNMPKQDLKQLPKFDASRWRDITK